MKFLILVGLIFITIQCSHPNKIAEKFAHDYFLKHENARKDCSAEIKVDQGIEHSFETSGISVNDENLGCFLKCLHLREKVINEVGEFSVDDLKIALGIPKTDMLIGLNEKCSQFDKIDLCKGSLELQSCYMNYLETRPMS